MRKYGLSPQDITDVVITHAHHDHIASVGDYNNAVIHIQREEYDFGKKYIPDNLQVSLFDDGKQLTDDVFVKKNRRSFYWLLNSHCRQICVFVTRSTMLFSVVASRVFMFKNFFDLLCK